MNTGSGVCGENGTYGVELIVGPVDSVCQPIKSQNADVVNATQWRQALSLTRRVHCSVTRSHEEWIGKCWNLCNQTARWVNLRRMCSLINMSFCQVCHFCTGISENTLRKFHLHANLLVLYYLRIQTSSLFWCTVNISAEFDLNASFYAVFIHHHVSRKGIVFLFLF